MTQQSSRCRGSEIIGELTTSSTVTTSRSMACGVVLGVARGGHLDPGQLGAGRAELVHVAHGRHGVLVHHGRAVGELERHVGHAHAVVARGGARGHALGSRPAGQGDQGHVALAGGDGLRGMADVDDVRRSARLRGVHVAELEPHVVGHGEPAQPGRVARAEVAVDVGPGEPGVLQRALGDLGVELGQRLVVGLAGGMLVDARDVGLSLDRHEGILSVPQAPAPPAPRESTGDLQYAPPRLPRPFDGRKRGGPGDAAPRGCGRGP